MAKIVAITCAVFTLGLVASFDTACAQGIARPERGLTLAQRLCSECHAVLKTQERSPNPAAPRFETIANVRGMTGIAIAAAFQTPHRQMPNIMLEPSDLNDVAAYILTLKRSE